MKLYRNQEPFTENDFKNCFKNYQKQIYRFLYYKTSNIEVSEDLTQNTFVALWENRHKVRQDTVLSYLYKIAENLFLNENKHLKIKENFHFLYLPPDINLESPEFVLEEKEFQEKLNLLLSTIPEKSRTVFLMNRIDRMSYEEISRALDISTKAVEKRMSVALQILKNNSLNI